MTTTANKSVSRGRPASYLPLGNKGQKFTISKIMAKLPKGENGKTMTRVSVTSRINALAKSGAVKIVDKQKAVAQGRPSAVYLIVQSLPPAASFKRKSKAQVVKAKAAQKAKPAPAPKKVAPAKPAPKSAKPAQKAPVKPSKVAVPAGLPATTQTTVTPA